MTGVGQFLKLFGVGAVVFLALDLLWLGVVARGFYQRHLGHLMRSDVRWVPALLFYLLFVSALVVFVAQPALERESLALAVVLGAFFGLVTYAAFDLTSLALMRDFPVVAAVVDLVWGMVLSAVTCTAIWAAGRAGLWRP